jgi:two-component system sensor histidine kinase MtrB
MELRKIVWLGIAVVGVTTLASSASLIGITSYLHRLTTQIDSNLQSVRATQEIEVQLLWHARYLHLADLTGDPRHDGGAEEAVGELNRWVQSAERYASSPGENAVLHRLREAVEEYLTEQTRLGALGRSSSDAYLAALAPFQSAYDEAEELLHTNLAQAAEAADQARAWDAIATTIGVSLAAVLLVTMLAVFVGARTFVYHPLLNLRDGILRFAARDYAARVAPGGAREIREIAGAFNDMAARLDRNREAQLSFIASIAHDLRTPLQAIQAGVVALAHKGAGQNDTASTALGIVSRQVDVLVRLISDLLDTARVEAGKFEIQPRIVDARQLATRSVELFRPATSLHELTAQTPDAAVLVSCDASRMEQVLNNLVSNALKYSPNGGAVTVGVRREPDHVVLEVRDQGIGIAPEEQDAVFEPFRRGSVCDTIPGVGLGLSASRSIVDAHGGEITLSSAVGRGSVFTVRLPAPARADQSGT